MSRFTVTGIPTAAGSGQWQAAQVRQMLARLSGDAHPAALKTRMLHHVPDGNGEDGRH
jgi:hypothetical protein